MTFEPVCGQALLFPRRASSKALRQRGCGLERLERKPVWLELSKDDSGDEVRVNGE